MSFLKVSKITKRYPGQKVNSLENVSFDLKQGEILAIVGENGSGKTTLLKLISGMEDANDGSILFQETYVKGPSFNLVPGHQQIKMLFQHFNLFPKHTIKENIAYNIRMLSDEEQESKIGELIKLCRLEGMENKLPGELSGGQQQRVALAKAIADEPLLLLMDEPFSNLDLFLKDEIKRRVIQQIRRDQNSAIFVTHDLKDALALADRIAVLKEGKILQIDTPKNIYEKPSDEYVAYLFGKVNIWNINDFISEFKLDADKKIYNDKKRKACVRPEQISLVKEEKSMTSGIVKYVSYLGDSFDLDVQTKKLMIRVNTRKKKIAEGDRVFLKVSKSKVHCI